MELALDEIRRRYRRSLASRVSTLESAKALWTSGNTTGLVQLRAIAHALTGSGATYGYPAISEAAALVEHAPEEDVLAGFEKLIAVLRSVAALE